MLTASVKFKSSSPAEDPATNETNILPIVETLATHYGRASHMVILDPSYRFFVTKSRTGALCYKLQDDVAIVTGDPLCESDLFSNVLDEFEGYRKKHGWKLAFIGISSTFVKYARQRRWTTIEFGVERVLNPMTNDVLMEQCGKRIIVQNKQLLHPAKRNLSLRIYIPSCEQDLCLEKELSNIYNEWRRRRSGITQAFVTVYDLFDFPHLMVYIYTCSAEGKANGFVALRWIGAHQGYHLDPCVTAPEAPKGVSDLLIYSTLVFLKQEEISYLSLGFEPLGDLKEITGMPVLLDRLTRSINRRVFQKFQFKGKKAHSDKFRPDEEQESPLYVVLPTGIFDIRQVFAVLHTANIHIRKLI
ncbi:hypothetical protein P175DRAFT_0512724 [Aspergillus ochraceoroseus IBT 24754]|nr:uncharacterized protein P175DRAFT_0512724 [Aspergillus ochraceoroseus IBT 24754]PTU16898.1 hypothetical protein P175DRAFT_0512724 [Aspergillus ochraceoroseus IBT 24754]